MAHTEDRTAGHTEEVEVLRKEVEALREDKKVSAIFRAVTKHDVVDADEVVELIKGHVEMDEDGNISVANGSGGSVTLDEYVEEWLSQRPHHLRPRGTEGSGSRAVMFSNSIARRYDLSDPVVWRTMPREDLDMFLREGIYIHGAGGQVYRFRNVRNPFVEARRRRFKTGG